MTALNNGDVKHWPPVPEVLTWLHSIQKKGAKILDVGPGHAPLRWATHAVDFVDVPNAPVKVDKCDITNERLPYKDKQFDFVYCRHLLEDSWNPFSVCEELSRVGKAGYVEVPSPMAEIGRGVDGSSHPWRGYHHHRFIGWVDGDELRLVTKYPLIEYLPFKDEEIVGLLRAGPRYWNTYYLWSGEIKVVHKQNPLDFALPGDYPRILSEAVQKSKAATDKFWSKLSKN